MSSSTKNPEKKAEWALWYKLFLGLALVIGLLLTVSLLWASGLYGLKVLAESFAEELAIFIPINKYLIKSGTYFIFLIFLGMSSLMFSISAKRRFYGRIAATVFLVGYNAILGFAALNNKFNPISGVAEKCFILAQGKVVYRDNTIKFDPISGKPCIPVTPEIASRLDRWERGERPRKIPDHVNPEMYDRTLGTPLVWFHRDQIGNIEIFDGEGFHPATSNPLQPITPEIVKLWQVQKKKRLFLKREKEKKERTEKEQKERIAEKVREAEKQLENKRIAEKRELELKAKNREEERQRLEEQKKNELAEISGECDRLAGNSLDRNRNSAFWGVPYKLLILNAAKAVVACNEASRRFPETLRLRYQLARALQAQKSIEAKPILRELVQQNYPAAYDNLGSIFLREHRKRYALDLFRAGSALGDPQSMFSLARILMEGKIARNNDQEVSQLLTSAAELGHPLAKGLLAKYEEDRRNARIGKKLILDIFGKILRQAN